MSRNWSFDNHNIYIISHYKDDRFASPVKIGIAGDVLKRLAQLQTASAYDLVITHVFPVPNKEIARDIEQCFHHCQSDSRLRGEWFDLDPLDAVALMCLYMRWTLQVFTELDEGMMAQALSLCGVRSAEEQLAKRIDHGSHPHH